MNNPNFDTHKFVEDMVRAKMPKAQAEVLANACLDLLNRSKDNLATKDDLINLEKRFGDNLEHSQQLLEGKIMQSEQLLEGKIMQSEQLLEGKIMQSEQRLRAEIEAVRAEIKQSEQRLWIRMLVMQITSVGLIIGALQYWS